MPQYIDSYYLIDTRKLEIVYDFFSKFFPSGVKELAEDYPFPELSDYPEKIYYSLKELLVHLDADCDSEYTVYLENKDKSSVVKQIILQYTDDGKIILGLSIIGKDLSSTQNIEFLKYIKTYLHSKNACATIEEPPPVNSLEFIDFCNKRHRM